MNHHVNYLVKMDLGIRLTIKVSDMISIIFVFRHRVPQVQASEKIHIPWISEGMVWSIWDLDFAILAK